MTRAAAPSPPPRLPTFSAGFGLLVASAVLVLVVSGAMLAVSLVSTRTIADAVATPRMDAAVRATEMQLNALFEPIRRQILSDYVALRRGRFLADEPTSLKDALIPRLAALPQVGSVMFGEPEGRQFLVMRYDDAARSSPLLTDRRAGLPPPEPGVPQFFTREVRPAQWGERSAWTLWSIDAASAAATWELPLPGYDPRTRPWHVRAMARFRDLPLHDAIDSPVDLVAWTDAYTLFTTKTPGISASVAARDPSGRVRIIAYDLLLAEIAAFTARSVEGRGQVFVVTDDGRVLGPPAAGAAMTEAQRLAATLQPVGQTPFPEMTQALAAWETRSSGKPHRWSMEIGGEPWRVGISEFPIGDGQRFWIGVLLPERDLVPEVRAGRRAILRITFAALIVAALLALLFARGFSRPVRALADQSRRITRLDLSEQPSVRTPIAELQALSSALQGMRHALRDHVAAIEQARRDLQEREREVRTLAENTPDVVARCDPAGRLLFVNPAFERATGLAAARVVGRRLDELPFPAELVTFWIPALRDAVASGAAEPFEFRYPTPEGLRDFEARVAFERDSAGALLSLVVVARDVTERHAALRRQAELEAQLRQAQKLEAVGLLAGGVAHDFNNLLQVIGGNAALVSADASPAENAEVVREIQDAVARASQMTRQLLLFSRRQPARKETLELGEVVASHLRMLRRMMPESIRLNLESPPSPVHVVADRGGVEQLLLNLCLNARDAMPGGGTIDLSVRAVVLGEKEAGQIPAGHYARLEVTDSGTGIAPEIAERIFEPFFSTKPRERGTGLGLSVVYGIVRQHEGHVEALNRAEGGARFVVHLPLAPTASVVAASAQPPTVPAGTGTVLVAEDDERVRALAIRTLERNGYHVIAAADGHEALRIFANPPRPIDLLFLDVLMPGLGGFETGRRCRQLRPEVPILFASGYAAESIEATVAPSTPGEILQKPYDPRALLAAVRRLLGT